MYRIDFYRLARTEEEIIRHKFATEFVDALLFNIDRDDLKSDNLIPDGYILDSTIIEDKPGLYGKEVFEKHIKPKYKEAILFSWDDR
jgi:hypothetical protein